MRRLLTIVAGVLAIQAAGGFLFAWSGLYSVAASKEHWPPVYWVLAMAMRNSVETHARFVGEPPDLDDMALVERGAGHYEDGCAPCHGAPDARRNPISRHMLPTPPYLPEKVADWTDRQLYWITLHGIKFAGMPAWPAQSRTDEPWAVAAFLRRLDRMDPAEYRRLAFGEEAADGRAHVAEMEGPAGDTTGGRLVRDEVLNDCGRCHGRDGAGRGSAAFPRIGGQSADYLRHALRAYAAGQRPSGVMEPIVSGLDDATLMALADHYAAQPPAPTGPAAPAEEQPDPRLLALGARLAADGDAGKGVPACSACHGPERDPRYPLLDGQHASYIAGQLRLWKTGARGDGPLSRIMAAAARDLTEEQIRALSLHYAARRMAEAER